MQKSPLHQQGGGSLGGSEMTSIGDVEDGGMSRASASRQSLSELHDKGEKVHACTLRCNNLNYHAGSGEKQKHILHNVNATFSPGEIVAVMGPSGSGKTTLLSCLSGRASGRIVGNVTVNGHPMNLQMFRKLGNFVPQLDILDEGFTSAEVLYYVVKLRLNQEDWPQYKVDKHVNQIFKDLGLAEHKDVIVGGANTKGLSGGQKKRLSIAMELVNNPSLLFLDEPTSGLDSRTAKDIVGVTKALTHKYGIATMCVIHQPPEQAFLSFDKLVLLQKGRVCFFDKPADVTKFLEQHAGPIPARENPADWMFDVLQESVKEEGTKEPPYAEFWKKHLEESQRTSNLVVAGNSTEDLADFSYEVPQWKAAVVVFNRAVYSKFKDADGFLKNLKLAIGVGVLLGLTFYDLENTQAKYTIRVAAIFMGIVYSGLVTTSKTLIKVPVEKALVVREYQNGYYSLPAWYIGSSLATIVLQTLTGIAFTIPFYFLAGFQTNFGIFLVTMVIMVCIGSTFGLFLGIFANDAQSAQALLTPAMMPLMIFCGFLIPFG